MADNTGGVPVIGTLVPAKEGAFPVVRGCDIGLSNGERLEEFLRKNIDSETLEPSSYGSLVDEIELEVTPFPEVSPNNNMTIRLKRSGRMVMCSIFSSMKLPDYGIIIVEEIQIPENFRPALPVYMPYLCIKNGADKGQGQFIVSHTGIMNIYTNSIESGERCASTTWMVR